MQAMAPVTLMLGSEKVVPLGEVVPLAEDIEDKKDIVEIISPTVSNASGQVLRDISNDPPPPESDAPPSVRAEAESFNTGRR